MIAKTGTKKIILRQAKKLPLSSGVYLFLGKNKQPLYIGRAISLRRRVLSYFKNDLDPRLKEMVFLAKTIKFFKTETILEAIILEANLIKKHWPKYNVKEKDNRSFIYLVFAKSDFPKPLIVRARELERFSGINKKEVFGPYQSLFLIKAGLRLLRKVLPYGNCRPDSGKPCFDYQIGLCPGACAGKISKHDNQKNNHNLKLFLKGQKKRLLKKLKEENPNQASALKQIQEVILLKEENLLFFGKRISRIEGYDVSHLAGKETIGSMVVFANGREDKSQYRLFKIKSAPANDDLRALAEMLERRFKHQEWHFPDLIMIDGGKPQIDFLTETIKKSSVKTLIVGISKFAKDKLVFPAKAKKETKELIESLKPTLLKVRDEAHRFALKNSRRQRKKKFLYKKRLLI